MEPIKCTAFGGLAFSISPSKKRQSNEEEQEENILMLAPFSAVPKINFGEVKVNELVERNLLIMNPQLFDVKLIISNPDLCLNNMEVSIAKLENLNFKLKWKPDKPDYYKYAIKFEVANSAKLKFLVHAFGICVAPVVKSGARKPFNVMQPIKKERSTTTTAAAPAVAPVKPSAATKPPPAATAAASKAANLRTVSNTLTSVSSTKRVVNNPSVTTKTTTITTKINSSTNKENKEQPQQQLTSKSSSSSSSNNRTTLPRPAFGTTRKEQLLSSTIVKKAKHRVPIDFYADDTEINDDDVESDKTSEQQQTIIEQQQHQQQQADEANRRETCVIRSPKVFKRTNHNYYQIDDESPASSSSLLKRTLSLGQISPSSDMSEFYFNDETNQTIVRCSSHANLTFLASGNNNYNNIEEKQIYAAPSSSMASTSTVKKAFNHLKFEHSTAGSSLRYGFVNYLEPVEDSGTPTLSRVKQEEKHDCDATPKISDFSTTTTTKTSLINKSKHMSDSTCISLTKYLDIEMPSSASCLNHVLNQTRQINVPTTTNTTSDDDDLFERPQQPNDATVIINANNIVNMNNNNIIDEELDHHNLWELYDSNDSTQINYVILCQRQWRMKMFRRSLRKLHFKRTKDVLFDVAAGNESATQRINVTNRMQEEILRRQIEKHQAEQLKFQQLQSEHVQKLNCLIKIQKHYRMKRFRRALDRLREAKRIEDEKRWLNFINYTIVCQRALRMKSFRKNLNRLKQERREEEARLLKCVLICQRTRRMKQFRMSLNRLREERIYQEKLFKSTIMVQQSWRMKMFRRSLQKLLTEKAKREKAFKQAILVCQRSFRMKQFRKCLNRLKEERALRLEQERIRLMNESASLIQQKWRMLKFRRSMAKYRNAALKIQHWFRVEMNDRLRFIRLKRSTIHLQRIYKRKHKTYVQAAILIQSCWRMHTSRSKYLHTRQSILLIQQWTRSMQDRYRFIKLKRSLPLIQSRARALVNMQNQAARTIQSSYRMYKFRRQMRIYRNAAIFIQRWHRDMQERYLFIRKKRIIMQIQALYRRIYMVRRESAAIKIQNAWRFFMTRKECIANRAATIIQAVWRGYKVRQSITTAQLISIRNRLSIYISESSSSCMNQTYDANNTLGARIRKSLQILNQPNVPIQQLIVSLNELVKVTRLSPECCLIFIQQGAVNTLYSFISNCNRSVPHMDLIKICLQILINLAKNNQTVEYVLVSESSLKILANLLQYYHLSNEQIFMDVCSLFILMARSPKISEYFVDHQQQETFIKKLLSIHSILERKTNFRLKLSQQKSKTSGEPQQQHQNHNLTLGSTQNFNSNLMTMKTVSLIFEPDWVLSTNKTVIELAGPLGALEHFLNTIGVKFNSNNSSGSFQELKTPKKSQSVQSLSTIGMKSNSGSENNINHTANSNKRRQQNKPTTTTTTTTTTGVKRTLRDRSANKGENKFKN